MASDLTGLQRRSLGELRSACDERIRYYGGEGWVRTFDLSGTPAERSATTLRSLVGLGLAQGRRDGGNRQAQWRWRITDKGRGVLDA